MRTFPKFKLFRIAQTLDGDLEAPPLPMVVVTNRLAFLQQEAAARASGRDRSTAVFSPPAVPLCEHGGGGWRRLQQELPAFMNLLNTSGGAMADTFPYNRRVRLTGTHLQQAALLALTGTARDVLPCV